jgi:hypothetical protein
MPRKLIVVGDDRVDDDGTRARDPDSMAPFATEESA